MRISDWSSDVCSSDLDLGTLEVSGALVARSNGGAIEQGGALLVGGSTELDDGAGDVTLANADNAFVGAVEITGGTVAITDVDDLTLGTVTSDRLTSTSPGSQIGCTHGCTQRPHAHTACQHCIEPN